MRTKQYSPRTGCGLLSTREAYIGWIRRYILFHHKRHPAEMGTAEVNAYLTDPAIKQHVAPSTQNQALSARLFLYRYVLRIRPASYSYSYSYSIVASDTA